MGSETFLMWYIVWGFCVGGAGELDGGKFSTFSLCFLFSFFMRLVEDGVGEVPVFPSLFTCKTLFLQLSLLFSVFLTHTALSNIIPVNLELQTQVCSI